MKQKLTIALLTVLFAFSAKAQNTEEMRQAAIAQTKQNIAVLCDHLERAETDEELYTIRLQIREQFKNLDQLVLSSPAFKTSK